MTVSSIVLGSGSSPTDLIHVAYLGEGEDLLMVGVPGKLLFILSIFSDCTIFLSFFSYPPSSGIALCVGIVGTAHMTPTLDAALLYVVHHISMNVQPCSLHAHLTHVCG